MVDEFEFFRKVQMYYQHITFRVQFTYRLFHRTNKTAQALGSLRCRVDPYAQIVEYTINIKSDPISRPFSEKGSLLFSSQYAEIPSQQIVIEHLPIYKLHYPVPIEYDWKLFIIEGANQIISSEILQHLFDRYEIKGIDGEEVDAKLKVAEVKLDWYNGTNES
ncbi:MAG: hypothetical protein ACE3K5_20080 [Candidatus Pristimantibacillus sp.]